MRLRVEFGGQIGGLPGALLELVKIFLELDQTLVGHGTNTIAQVGDLLFVVVDHLAHRRVRNLYACGTLLIRQKQLHNDDDESDEDGDENPEHGKSLSPVRC